MSSEEASQTRRELLQTIESQRESIGKYERRLRDVVRAYKGLAKEKEALEETLRAISGKGEEDDDKREAEREGEGATTDKVEANSANDDASSTASGSDAGGGGGGGGGGKRGSSEAKVRTLTASIATLTAEKSRLEVSFQEDRKKILQAKKEKEQLAEDLQKELTQLRAKSKQDLEEAKSKLIIERHEHEKATSDHAVMLRELQKLLSEERRAKEKAENSRHEAEERFRQLESGENRNKEQDRRVKVLEGKLRFKSEEVEKLSKQLRDMQLVEMESLRKQMEDARRAHRRELGRVERRAEDAEARAVEARVEQEQRVHSLEARLQELSETVGTYDRIRQHDLAEIEKLREKVQQVGHDREAALSRSSSISPTVKAKEEEEEEEKDFESFHGLDVQAMLDRYYRLKAAIKERNKQEKNPMDLESLFSEDSTGWRKKFDDLSVEFEAYKKAMGSSARSSPSPSRGAAGGGGGGAAGLRYLLPEVDQEVVLSLRTQISELQDKLAVLRSQLMEKESVSVRLAERERELVSTISSLKQSSKDRLDAVEAEYRGKVLGLETELQKQRERCLTLIEEKEDEVNMLKANMELAFENSFAAAAATVAASSASPLSPSPTTADRERELQLRRAAATTIANTAGSGRKSRKSSHRDHDLEESLTDKMKLSSPNEGMVLHYVQELSHRDVEIGNLRRQVFEVEAAMRELQMSAIVKEEKYVDQIDSLNETVGRLKRMGAEATTGAKGGGGGSTGGRGGVNLEYLKNVVLSYMLSSDAASRDHMLKAIGAVLFFSRAEMKQVHDYNLSWFWSHSQGSVTKKGHR